MAVYKLIQDIEAEDKLLGPLSLKGFIYALTAGGLAFLNFKLVVTTGLGSFRWLLLLIFSMPMILFAVLASPLGREQPTEIWLLSRVRFLVKSRRRVWDQTGLSDLVTITAPKKIDRHLTKDLSQLDVQGRLQALAMTMDSRGWAIKNVNLNDAPANIQQAEATSDRLVSATNVSQQTPIVDVRPDEDILDEQNNPTAKKFLGLVRKKDAEHKAGLASRVNAAKSTAAIPKKGQPAYHVDEDKLDQKFAEAEAALHAKHGQHTKTTAQTRTEPPVTAESRADKLELAQSGNDLSVASIQKLANRQPTKTGSNEVEVSLHS